MSNGRFAPRPDLSPRLAGVDETIYWDFRPGDRVMTVDGFAGRVTSVESGPIGGAESYIVVLDGGVGGGEYSSSDLTAEAKIVASVSEGAHTEAAEHHVASEDYPELAEILVDRPPPTIVQSAKLGSFVVTDADGDVVYGPTDNSFEAQDFMGDDDSLSVETWSNQQGFAGWGTGSEPVAETPVTVAHRKEAGPFGWLVEKVIHEDHHDNPRGNWSWDWCRYRRDSRCYYPKDMDYEATRREGYAVWIPVDRGYCPRGTWEKQQACPISQPGPNSGEPDALLDATVPYSEGGQRGGHPVVVPRLSSLARMASDGPPLHSHARSRVEAAWADVQAKAADIRRSGGVRVLSVTDRVIAAEVRGSSGNYISTIERSPGSQAIDQWTCTCPWYTYAFGRSGRWLHLEGRKCAHATALFYEIGSQEFGGGSVVEQVETPEWAEGVKPTYHERERPGAWRVGSRRQARIVRFAMPRVDLMPDLPSPSPTPEQMVDWYIGLAQCSEPSATRDIQSAVENYGGGMEGLQYRIKAPDSLDRKFRSRSNSNQDPRLLVADVLRYTGIFHPSVYAIGVRNTLYDLESRGYTVVEEENTWQRGDPYSALHYTLQDRNGTPIELQFHTADSFNLKQNALHTLYEEFRDNRTPLARRQELFDIMAAYWDDVEIPKDALAFPGEQVYMRPTASRTASVDGKWRGRLVKLISLLPGGRVLLDTGDEVPAREIEHPSYHPTKGLTAMFRHTAYEPEEFSWEDDFDTEAVLHDEPEPALPTSVGRTAAASDPRAWLLGGPQGDDVAEAARSFLAKTSAKAFSPAEQQEIINEGEGVVASNLGDLDLRGTHYELLQDDDELW